MTIIEPHIHMYSRTTNDYQAMYEAGIRACVEPSFWLGADRRHAGTFFDYFRLILDFEAVRAERFGIDHFAAISLNPKETEDKVLADEVIDGLPPHLDHPRCVALGEIGYNNITPHEQHAFERQLDLAKQRDSVVIVHLPHTNKLEGTKRSIDTLRSLDMNRNRIILDHNTEETIAISRDSGCWCGMTVYPISKLTPERVSNIIREHGSDRMIVNGSADWGVSDPLSLVKVVRHMANDGHTDATIQDLVFQNAMDFYSASPNWKPRLDLAPIDPHEFQR